MRSIRRPALVLCVSLPAIALAVVACGGTASVGPHGVRASGQSALMAGSLAGKCDPAHQEKPFVIEWDATDMSSFEAHAAKDVVFVKYDGCELQVIDGCVEDSLPGHYGNYNPPAWTSGSIEQFDVKNSDDLYAKLPLGAASLGGRVESGEQFHMKYFVSGLATATRTKEFRGLLAKNPACADATHFVYAYNLGAFELGSSENSGASVNAGFAGMGAGGDHSHEQHAEKHGGDLSACSGDTAKEGHLCRVPIRLVVKPITAGDDPNAATQDAATVENTKIGDTKLSDLNDAGKHRAAAMQKFQTKDGAGCLQELDQGDQLDPDPLRASTSQQGGQLTLRAMCEMLAGHCKEGKRDFRIASEHTHQDMSPEELDRMTTDMAGNMCRGNELGPRDRMVAADRALRDAERHKDASACIAQYNILKALLPTIGPDDEQQKYQRSSAEHAMYGAGGCAAEGGQCGLGKQMQREIYGMLGNQTILSNQTAFDRSWAAQHPSCQ